MINKLLNILLRGSTLISKFVLIFILARYLEVEEVGLYGLFAATIVYGGCALGFEFHTYSTRQLLARPKNEWANLLRDSCVFYGITYLLLLPCLAMLFEVSVLPFSVCFPFYVILILEHIGLEFNRLFVAVSETLFASVLIFIRTSCWMLLVALCVIAFPSCRNLEFIFLAWAAGAALSCCLGWLKLRRLVALECDRGVDWAWIAFGVKQAGYFFASSISLVSLHVLDRYVIEFIGGLELLSAYVLFSGISNALGSFLDAGVFVFYYPKMITAYYNKDTGLFFHGVRKMSQQVVVLSGLFSVVAYLLLDYLLAWLNKPTFYENKHYFYWLVGAAFIKAVSLLPQYALYACGVDKPIVQSNIFSLVFFIFSVAILSFQVGSIAVPAALACCYSLQFFWRVMAWKKYSRIVW